MSSVVARRVVDQTSLAVTRRLANRVSPDLDQAVADRKWIVAGWTVVARKVVVLAFVMGVVNRHPISVPISPAVDHPALAANLADASPADRVLMVAADPTAHALKAAAESSIATCGQAPTIAVQRSPIAAQVVATACGMAHAIAMTGIECQHAMRASGSTRWNANWTACCKKFTICETSSDNAG
jgi:hypothetical protein